jgi:hypothetical protein
MRERLPVALGSDAKEEDVHRTLASEAKAPDEVVRSAHVVSDDPGLAGLDHGHGVLEQIPLETPSRQEPGVFAVSCNQHQRTGLAVRRACRMNEQTHRNGVACGAFPLEQRQQRAK